ncbi:MAG: R3H domain-containing nucleic acid-binding protein [Myxococcota bacterium]|jgi:predicted RNA-binding protein Jag|nr:R3H domain-containing nucleic acid-binding protein [Myxococcota bacterium]
MYDAKNEPNEFVGDDREEAVSKACRFFGASEGDLNIAEPPGEDVFGSGARVVVVAVPKNAKPPQPGSGDGGGRRERGGRDRGDRGGRGRDRNDRNDRGRDRGRERDRDREVVTAKAEAPKTESKGTVEGDVGEVGQFILGIVERMKLGEFRISESAEGDFCVYELRGEAALALGTGDGRAVDALQLLGNQFAMRASDDAPRVVVDAEGDAEKRTDFLERLARRAAGRATDTGRSVALDPMNGRDRRVLHMKIRDMDGVATMSVGEGRYRQVVVVPEGADEYDEAVESTKAAENQD